MAQQNKTIIKFPAPSELVLAPFVKLFENNYRYVILWGGRNSGKSYSIVRYLLYLCLTEKYFKCLLLRKQFNTIKDSMWELIKSQVEEMGLSSLFTFTVSPLAIKCANGNTFICRGLDDPGKIKSLSDPTVAWYEETSELESIDEWLKVSQSLRSTKTKKILELFSLNPETSNPDYQDFWLYQTFFKPFYDNNTELAHNKSFDYQLEYANNNRTSNSAPKIIKQPYTVIHTTYMDNLYLSDSQRQDIENLKLLNSYYYQIYCLGEWSNKYVKDRFLKDFDKTRNVSELEFDKDANIIIGFDENVNPYPAISLFQLSDNGLYRSKWLKQITELALFSPRNKLVEVAKEIDIFLRKRQFNSVTQSLIIMGDATSDKEDAKLERGENYFTLMRRYLQSYGYNVLIKKENSNPNVQRSAEFLNAIFLNNFCHLKIDIDTNCKYSINDYLIVQENGEGRINKVKKNGVEQCGHFTDILRYVVCQTFKDDYASFNARVKKVPFVIKQRSEMYAPLKY